MGSKSEKILLKNKKLQEENLYLKENLKKYKELYEKTNN